jgi:hypothetical protein
MGKLSAKVLVSHRFDQIVSFGCISVMRMNIAQKIHFAALIRGFAPMYVVPLNPKMLLSLLTK